MYDVRLTVRAHMRAMSERLGGVEGAAAAVGARWGDPVSKGTISRKRDGSLEWTVADVVAFEDALGVDAVTQALARRFGATEAPRGGNLTVQAGVMAREVGEAVGALLHALDSARPEDRARAIRELDEAAAAIHQARGLLEAGETP